jgi:hypothetical protein
MPELGESFDGTDRREIGQSFDLQIAQLDQRDPESLITVVLQLTQ